VFFFSKVELLGWFSTFSKVCASLALAVTVSNLAYRVWEGVVHLHASDFAQSVAWLFQEEESPTSFRSTEPTVPLPILITQWITLIFFVLMIELPLLWSNVEGVNTLKSTGQIIPFSTGLVVCMQTASGLLIRKWGLQ
jgi:hypothetical protein